MIFGGRAEALRVVQDANRALSVGHLMTTAAAEDYVLRHIASLSANGTVDTNVINGVISTRLTIPAADLTATGMFDGFATLNILIVAQHLSES